MANIKSAKKRIKVIQTKTLRNKIIKSQVKTAVKKVTSAIQAENKNLALENLPVAISSIKKAASKGIFHKKTASRRVARLTKAINKMA